MSSDRLNGDISNNLIDEYIEENDVFAMEVDVDEYCDKHVGLLVVSSVDSDSDHGGDVASLSNFSESDCDSLALTDVPEENDDFLEENVAEIASNPSLFGSDRGGAALDAEIADLLVDLDDGLVIIRAEYEELEEVQEELANPLENEGQIEENQVEVVSNPSFANVSSLLGDSVIESIVDEEDLVNNFEENEEELDENQVELANPVANEEQIEELGTNLEEEQIEANQVAVASESGHASITDLLASSVGSFDGEGAEAMVEDVDAVILVDDDVIMVDFVSDSNSQPSVIQDVEENVNFPTAALIPTVSLASSESSTQGVLDDHSEASELRKNRELFLQSVPVATAASDSAPSLTPSEEFNFRISIERTRLREMEREAAELQARVDEQEVAAEQLDEQEVAAEQLDEQEVAAEQHTGYGIVEGNLDYILDFEGVLPKLPLFSLISNWLSNAENNFNLFI